MQKTESKTVIGRTLSRENRINKNTSLTTVHRFGIQQAQVTVSPGAHCTVCRKCTEGYLPHLWRKVCRTCFCPIEDHEGAVIGGSGPASAAPGRLPMKDGVSHDAAAAPSSGSAPRVRKKIHSKFHELEKLTQEAATATLSPKSSRDNIRSGKSTPPTPSTPPLSTISSTNLPPPPSEMLQEEEEYVWAPKDLDTQEKVDNFMQQLPDEIRPVADKQQEWNKKQMQQMPLHDAKLLETVEPGKEMAEFIKNRERSYCEGTVQSVRKQVCPFCNEDIEDSNLAVQSDLVPGKSWHPGCFRCSTCKDFLVNLVHFIEGGKLYCGRHHAELTRPRCGGCDELIFEQEYTLAGGSKWHTHHFCCFYCDKPLGTEEEEYVTHEGQVVCLPCFDDILAGHCEVCKEKIGAGEHQLSCDDHHWHENCFKCSSCEIKLDSEDFLMHENKVFCSECYSNNFGEQCDRCKQVIKGKLITANKKHFHLECFVCADCAESLTGRKFYKRDSSLYCAPCYDKNFAVACAKCTQYVRTQGLRCKDKVYHKDCFLCTTCGKSLVSCSVVARSGGVYCHACVE